MNKIHSELTPLLKGLRLPVFRECYQSEADLARQESLSHEAYLLELAKRESEGRSKKRIARYLLESKLFYQKYLNNTISSNLELITFYRFQKLCNLFL